MASLAQLSPRLVIGLEAQGLASPTDDAALDFARSKQRVVIGHRFQASCVGGVLAITEVVAICHRIPGVCRVQRLAAAHECVRLDEDLGSITSVDPVVDILKVAVVDVPCTEADGWRSRVDVVPVVVVLGDV